MSKFITASLFGILAMGCADYGPVEPSEFKTPALQLVVNGPLPFTTTGDCSQAVFIDLGTTKLAGPNVIIQGRVFDCPVTGDLEGTNRVTWTNAVLRPDGGHITGTTEIFVESFFGRSDLEGSFTGEFSGSLDDLLFGVLRLTRHGTGDFLGVVMHTTFYQDPPGSGITVNTGTMVGH